MEVIIGIYFFYMFISIYFLVMTIILYFQNRSNVFFSPKITKNYSLSVIIPAWNEEDTIARTIEHIFASDYPGLKEVIVVNDGSTDRTSTFARKLMKKYKNL